MTLEDLGNLGEFVGAIGVVATLIYLALQIRQNSHQISENTNSVRSAVEQENAQSSSDFLLSLAQNPALARTWRLGLSEPAELTDEEGTQFVMLMGATFHRLEGRFRQYERGLLSADSWEPWEHLISRYLRSPAVATWWSRGDIPFDRSFVEYVDSKNPTPLKRGAAPVDDVLAPIWPDTDGSPDE